MTKELKTTEDAYGEVVRHFSRDKSVMVGSKGKKGFGANALKIRGKIFAMVSSKGAFVVKLPGARVEELIAEKAGRRFTPAPGRVMKEWVEVASAVKDRWIALAEEAKVFVGRA